MASNSAVTSSNKTKDSGYMAMIKKYKELPLLVPTTTSANGENGHDASNHAEGSENAFEIVHINDFASEAIKAESAKLENGEELESRAICSAYHGGPLDYPKVATVATASVAEKWDYCFNKLEILIQSKKQREPLRPSVSRMNSDEDVYEQLTGDSLRKAEPFSFTELDKQAAAIDESKTNEEEFFSAINESVSKLLFHNLRLSKEFLKNGDMYSAYKVLAAMALLRNKLWHYNEYIVVESKAKPFQEQYTEVCQIIEAMSEQVLESTCSLLATSVLQDPGSQDWTNSKPFYEGEKISHNIQMWWYFLQGFKLDLWNTIPSKTAMRIFTGVFSYSLDILTSRLSRVSPHLRRVKQFRADITAILMISGEVLLTLCGSLEKLMHPDINDPSIGLIHKKCNHLMTILTVIASPIGILNATLPELSKPLARMRKKTVKDGPQNTVEVETTWMRLMRPDLFQEKPTQSSETILISKLLVNLSEPCWPLVVQTLLGNKMAVAKLILTHFGAFVPGKRGDTQARLMTDGCSGFGCQTECLGAADLFWPQAVGTAVLTVAMAGSGDPKILCTLVGPLLEKLSKSSWETLNKGNLWNPRKPVCFEAIGQILESYLTPVLLELFTMVDSGKAWTQNHLDTTMKEVLHSVLDVVPIIPIQILHLTKLIDDKSPAEIKPLAKSSLAHMIVSNMYSTISKIQPMLKRRRIAREKLDFIIAFGEALCNLDTSVDLLQIQNVADQTISDDFELPLPSHNFDHLTQESSYVIAELVANDLLADATGSFALKTLYRFLCYNVDWIQSCLEVPQSEAGSNPGDGNIPVLIRPWGSEIYPPRTPYEMMNQIARNIRIESLMGYNHQWEVYIKHVLLHNNPVAISELLRLRPELSSDEATDKEKAMANEVHDLWQDIRMVS